MEDEYKDHYCPCPECGNKCSFSMKSSHGSRKKNVLTASCGYCGLDFEARLVDERTWHLTADDTIYIP